jgi:hypothetical protein
MFTMQLVGVQPRRVRDGRRPRLVCEQCADLQRHRVCIDACGPVAYSIAWHPRVLRCILHAFARVCECLRVRASACACERAHGHMFMRVCNGARCRFCTPSLHGAHRASVDASAERAPSHCAARSTSTGPRIDSSSSSAPASKSSTSMLTLFLQAYHAVRDLYSAARDGAVAMLSLRW